MNQDNGTVIMLGNGSRALRCISVFFLLCCHSATCFAVDWDWWIGGEHAVSAGPELLHFSRIRDNGLRQAGVLYGAHVVYERIHPNSFYWGAEGHYARGTIDGSKGASAVRSRFYEREIDARFGWTFSCEAEREVLLTLFGGWSDYQGVNDLIPPSSAQYRSNSRLVTFLIGSILRVQLSDNWRVALRVRLMHLYDGTDHITGHPVAPDTDFIIGDRTHSSYALPITYSFNWKGMQLHSEVVPFYDFRYLGDRLGFPYSYIGTRFRSLGVRAMLTADF